MSRPQRAHVIGAGLAGLSAAIKLIEAGIAVTIHEAAPQAGGRCRSYFDAALGCRIDNGNHLLIAGNHATMSYLDAVGAADTLTGPAEASYPFLDLATGERWEVKPSRGRIPWWLFDKNKRIPGTGVADYLRAAKLARARPEDHVADLFDMNSTVFKRLWEPLAVAALNTEPEQGSAQLLARVLRESFGAGGEACRPLVPREGLSESLIEPAIRRLVAAGTQLRLGARLRNAEIAGDRVASLHFDSGDEPLGPEDAVVLAVPAAVAPRMVPGIEAPDEFRAIVNAHYRATAPEGAPFFVGLIGGTAEWVFRKREVLSVTISAADRLIDQSADALAPLLWTEVCRAYELGVPPMPAWQIVKERRATFAATPAQIKRRPKTATRWPNLVLAGDWIDNGLPATIEGSIRTGFAAAAALLKP